MGVENCDYIRLLSKVVYRAVENLKIILLVVLLSCWASFGRSSEVGRMMAGIMFEVGETKLALAKSVLSTATDFVTRNPDIGALSGYSELRSFVGVNKSFRSILVLNAQGKLLFDSFNMIPFFKPDLSDRKYYRDGIQRGAGEIYLHAPVVGRQSGLPFLPMTRKTMSLDLESTRLLMLTFNPDALIPDIKVCNYCGMVVLRKGAVIASDHVLSSINEDIAARLDFKGDYGELTLSIRAMNVSIHWKRSEVFDLIYVYYSASGEK